MQTAAAPRLTDHTRTDDDVWGAARRELAGGTLSIIMPVHNLGHAIAANIRQVQSIFIGRIPFEIVAVDDGSTDQTRAELESVRAAVPQLHPVYIEVNSGKGNALRRGFEVCVGSHVLLLDGDLDLPPEQVSGFFRIMAQEQADVVIGSKRHPDSVLHYPWQRRLISTVYYLAVKCLVGLPIHDTQTGIKLFKRDVLAYTFPRMLVKTFAFDLEILSIAHEKGFKVAEAPITLNFQFTGTLGCLRPRTVQRVLLDTLAIFYRLRILKYYRNVRETRMPEPPPLVSIVIALPAPTAYLDECLAGIARQTYRHYEVILLPDTASGRDWPPPIRELPTGPVRPAEKRNLGIAEARGPIVAFLDDDAAPAEEWLQKAVAYFSDETVAGVGGPAVTPANDPYLAKLSGLVYANRFVSGNYRYRYAPDRVRDVDDYPTCNLLVRTEVLRRLGGFRTDYWPGEDTYLCLEIVTHLHRKIVYDPWVLVTHHRRSLFLPHLRQIGRYALHRGYFARKFPATSRRLSYMMPSLFVAGLLAGAVLSVFCPPLRLLYLAALTVYVLLTALSCIQWETMLIHFQFPVFTWFLTWLGVVATHLVYGTRFLQGLLAPRMPGTVQHFDHPSEGGGAAGGRGGGGSE